MIGSRQLVLHDQDAVVCHVAADHVKKERPDLVLGRGQLNVQAEGFGKSVSVAA